ncbi:MAG: hypothetical protein ABIA76_00045 [Candidatus Diapherotrites archaeon]
MVLILLAKITVLEKASEQFKNIIIPEKVFEEVVIKGKEKKYEDSLIIEKIIKEGKIKVVKVKKKKLIERINDFNVQGGEAEAIALYWETKAEFLLCDDNNVRKKEAILELNLLGTPSIILELYKKKKITKEKALNSIEQLKKDSWFNQSIIDYLYLEVLK